MIKEDILLKYIGCQIVGATTDAEKVTNFFNEGNKIFCVIDGDYEAEFDCVIVDLCNEGKFLVKIK